MTAHQTIQALVAPVVLISANGLISLAIYNRMAAVVSRARAFHKEWFELFAQLSGMDPARRAAVDAVYLAHRIDILHELGHRMTRRAKLLRDSLYCLLLSVLCMLGCSAGLGLAPLAAWVEWIAVGLFYLGAAVMMAGVVYALRELDHTLESVDLEHETIERWHADWQRAERTPPA